MRIDEEDFIGLDFETFGLVDLPKHGLERYVSDPSFEIIIASIAEKGRDTIRFDFVESGASLIRFKVLIRSYLDRGYTIVAHNAGFERRVLKWLGFTNIDHRVIDSAVMARLLHVGSKLEVASRQLTDSHKLEAGYHLMRVFSIPHEGYTKPSREFCEARAEDWETYGYYCDVDAEAGLDIVLTGIDILRQLGDTHTWERECAYELLTAAQNQAGWPVDLEAVKWMNNRSWANSEIAKAQFIQSVGGDLNFKSPIQLKKFCHDRGIMVKSLDKYQAPVWLDKVNKMLLDPTASKEDLQKWSEVQTMLEIKLEIGGSMLSKLPKILDLVSADGRLRDQYFHLGAGQTFRTTGKSVQMQNLARLDKKLRDLSTLSDYSVEWSNTDMAGQLRQVFLASEEKGELFVGDFSAVESRGLAYLAGEEWKLDVYREGRDLYKELVVKYDGIPYEDVTDELRPKGKYSELSAGYQASGRAVQEFMFRLGFVISLEEATEWVINWREACPAIVKFWHDLDDLLHYVVASRMRRTIEVGYGMLVDITPFTLPSMAEKHPGSTSLCIRLYQPGNDEAIVTRFVHGVYQVKSNNRTGLAYYKATETLGEKGLWSDINETATQKANQGKAKGAKRVSVKNTIYGGKLAGILTQSLCRELFFVALAELAERLKGVANANIIGQFHDEVVTEWAPPGFELKDWEVQEMVTAEQLKTIMHEVMSHTFLEGFPLDAEIKHAHRYIK